MGVSGAKRRSNGSALASTQTRLLVVIALMTAAYVLFRFGSHWLDAHLEAALGVFQTTQRWGKTTWLWAFNETTPLRLERWLIVLAAATPGYYLLLQWGCSPGMGRRLWPSSPARRALAFGVLAAMIMAAFWLLRLKIAWGDVGRYEDYMLRGVVPGQTAPPQPKALFMSSPLTTLAFYGFYFGFFSHVLTPEDSVALVNVCAGGIFVLSALSLTSHFRAEFRPFALLALVTLPAVALFFGYREATAVSASFMLAFLAAGMAALRSRRARFGLLAALFLGLAIAAHGLAYYLLPAWAWLLLFLLWRSPRLGGRWRKASFAAAAAVILVAPIRLLFLLARLRPELVFGAPRGDAGFEQVLFRGEWIALLRANCANPDFPKSDLCYALFSPYQFVDLLDITARLAPALLLGLGVGVVLLLWRGKPVAVMFRLLHEAQAQTAAQRIRGVAGRAIRSPAAFWVLAASGSVSFLLLWPPGLGFEHDWDLYAPGFLVLAVCVLVAASHCAVAESWGQPRVRWAGALLLAVDFAGLVEFLLLLQPWLFGSVFVPWVQRLAT